MGGTPVGQVTLSTEVITQCFSPIKETERASLRGSSLSGGNGFPEAVAQNLHERVQISPKIMKVAVRLTPALRLIGAPAAAADRVESMLPDDMSYLAVPLVVVESYLEPIGFFMFRYLIMLYGHFRFYLLSNWYKCNDFFDIILTPYPNRVEIGSQRVFLLFIPQNIVIFNRINPNLSH